MRNYRTELYRTERPKMSGLRDRSIWLPITKAIWQHMRPDEDHANQYQYTEGFGGLTWSEDCPALEKSQRRQDEAKERRNCGGRRVVKT